MGGNEDEGAGSSVTVPSDKRQEKRYDIWNFSWIQEYSILLYKCQTKEWVSWRGYGVSDVRHGKCTKIHSWTACYTRSCLRRAIEQDDSKLCLFYESVTAWKCCCMGSFLFSPVNVLSPSPKLSSEWLPTTMTFNSSSVPYNTFLAVAVWLFFQGSMAWGIYEFHFCSCFVGWNKCVFYKVELI